MRIFRPIEELHLTTESVRAIILQGGGIQRRFEGKIIRKACTVAWEIPLNVMWCGGVFGSESNLAPRIGVWCQEPRVLSHVVGRCVCLFSREFMQGASYGLLS